MNALELADQIARLFEGFKPKPYRCPANVATIGFGTTIYPTGRKVMMADPPIDVPTAETYLSYEMKKAIRSTIKYCPILLTDEKRLAAIADFVYNLGAGNLQSSTLRRKINQQDWPEVRKQLMRWTRGGGRVLNGLVKRRKVEASLI